MTVRPDPPPESRLEARIASYELAAKMQLAAPEAFDLSREPESIRKAYGLEEAVTADFGRRCLLAARLAERGATDRQLMAIYGWTKVNMATHYTEQRDRKKLAAEGMKLIRLERPENKEVSHSEEKSANSNG